MADQTEDTRASEEPRPQISERRRRIYRIPVVGAIAYVIAPPRTGKPSKVRRVVSWASVAVAVLGLGMVAYPWVGQHYPGFYRIPVETLIAWSNFLSDRQTNRIQDRLETEFLAIGDPTKVKEGEPLTRIEIPAIGVDTIVVEGIGPSALRAGAGHYPDTPLPGKKGNVAIAGHRTTYGRPFNKVDRLKSGDEIILTTPVGRFTYQVSKAPWITTPSDWGVVAQSEEALLTLTSCHPLGSARERIIVRAKLVRTEPASGASAAA